MGYPIAKKAVYVFMTISEWMRMVDRTSRSFQPDRHPARRFTPRADGLEERISLGSISGVGDFTNVSCSFNNNNNNNSNNNGNNNGSFNNNSSNNGNNNGSNNGNNNGSFNNNGNNNGGVHRHLAPPPVVDPGGPRVGMAGQVLHVL